MNENLKHCYEFGPFRVDAVERELLREGDVVHLTPKAFDVLLKLVANSGHTLEREKLMDEVWADAIVEDNNLSDNISLLRHSLGDDPKEPRYIKTIPRRGYRFVADVREVKEEGADLLLTEQTRARIVIEEDKESDAVATNRLPEESKLLARIETKSLPAWKPLMLIVATVIVVIAAGLGIGGGVYLWKSRAAKAAQPDRTSSSLAVKTMAVLPFKPLVQDSRDESLELGMADTLITRLGSLREITVRPTSAVRKYTDVQQDAVAAGRELLVDSVLDGTIQREGERIRVTARLLRVSDGSQLWASSFDEKFTNIFAVQDSISERVTGALALKLTSEEQKRLTKRYTENAEAYQLYLRGRFHWNKFNDEGLTKAIGYFNQALAIDPSYTLAYQGLSDSYGVQGALGIIPPRDVWPKAKQAAERAVALDDTLAEAHTALGDIKVLYEWDWTGAERELKRAVEINPNFAQAHELYGYYLEAQGRLSEAMSEIKRAQELDPLSPIINMDLAWVFYEARQQNEAIEQFRKTLELEPNPPSPQFLPGLIYAQKGAYEQAEVECQEAISSFGRDPSILSVLGYVYGVSGKKGEAQKLAAELTERWKRRYFPPFDVAISYAGIGEKDKAFAWLEKAFEARDPQLIWLKVEPELDTLHSDPRYADLLRRMGLTP